MTAIQTMKQLRYHINVLSAIDNTYPKDEFGKIDIIKMTSDSVDEQAVRNHIRFIDICADSVSVGLRRYNATLIDENPDMDPDVYLYGLRHVHGELIRKSFDTMYERNIRNIKDIKLVSSGHIVFTDKNDNKHIGDKVTDDIKIVLPNNPSISLERTLYTIGLKRKTANALFRGNLKTVGDIIDKTETENRSIRAIGDMAMDDITSALKRYELELKA